MAFRFRLTFFKPLPSFFQFEQESLSIKISEDLSFTLTARDQDKLCEATKFHIEGVGYESKDEALLVGEKVRLHMQIINAFLGLELSIPDDNTQGSKFSDHVKEKLKSDQDIILVDTVRGLNIFPDSDNYIEQDMTGYGDVFPNNPRYIVDALIDSWSIDFGDVSSSKGTKETVEILNSAEREKSLRIKFLLTYAALERVVDRLKRSEEEIQLLEIFIEQINDSNLENNKIDSLSSSLGNLKYTSFKYSLFEKLNSFPHLTEIQGKPVVELVNEVVEIRNRIAHRADIGPEGNLSFLIDKLRQLVMSLIWNTHQLPTLTINRPPSEVVVRSMNVRIIK